MKKNILIVSFLVFTLNFANGQNWKKIDLKINLEEDKIGFLESLIIQLHCQNKKLNKLKVHHPGSYGRIIWEFRHEDSTKWLKTGTNIDMIPEPSYKFKFKRKQPISMTLISATFYNFLQTNNLSFGKHYLRATYFPINTKRYFEEATKKCKKCVQTVVPFYIIPYEGIEKKARDYLLTLDEPDFMYNLYQFGKNPTSEAEKFIKKFPNSKFRAWAEYLGISYNFEAKKMETIEKYEALYRRVKNPYLKKLIDSDLDRLYYPRVRQKKRN